MHDARSVANDLLRRAGPAGFTPVQLQNLVYFAYAGLLAIHHRPLVRQEYQAWRFGPVIPDLYHSVRQHGANTVSYAIPGFDCPEYDADTEQLVSHICDRWGRWPGARLAFLPAGYGLPWWRTYYGPGQNDQPTIPNALIERYYRRALEKINAEPQSD